MHTNHLPNHVHNKWSLSTY